MKSSVQRMKSNARRGSAPLVLVVPVGKTGPVVELKEARLHEVQCVAQGHPA